MPLVRKSDSSATVTKRKTSPKVTVSTTRQPSTIREMGDTAFGTLDSSDDGSIVINQAIRDDLFNAEDEFIPVSAANCAQLYDILVNEKPVIHTLGE